MDYITPIVAINTGTNCNSMNLPALIYRQGNRRYMAITLPCKVLDKFVDTSKSKNKAKLISKQALNRFLDIPHKNGIKDYVKCEEKFTIPPITLVSTENISFKPAIYNEDEIGAKLDELLDRNGSVAGIAVLPIDYKFICLDGNHRVVALKEIVEEHSELVNGSHLLLNIVFEKDERKIRQDFVDINKNSRPTSAAINTFFDTRDKLSRLASEVLENYSYIESTTELAAPSVSKNSKDIYTINQIRNAIAEIMGANSQSKASLNSLSERLKEDNMYQEGKRRFTIFFDSLKDSNFMKKCVDALSVDDKDENMKAASSIIPAARNESIILSGVGLIIVARVAGAAFEYYDNKKCVEKVKEIINYDWSRENAFLKAKILNPDGKIISSAVSISETSKALIKELLPETIK